MKTIRKITILFCLLAVVLQFTGIELLTCKAATVTTEASTKKEQKEIRFVKNGIAYHVIAKKKVEIEGFWKNSSTISIPEKVKHKGKTYKVTQIADGIKCGASNEPEVYLEGEYAPDYMFPAGYVLPRTDELICSKLILPKTIEYIGEGAFFEAEIKEIEFASKYRKLVIGKYAFGKNGPEGIVFPEGTREIGDYATWYASNITIPKTVRKIGAGVVTRHAQNV